MLKQTRCIPYSKKHAFQTVLASQSFYATTKKLSAAAPTAPWNVKDLFIGQESSVIAGKAFTIEEPQNPRNHLFSGKNGCQRLMSRWK